MKKIFYGLLLSAVSCIAHAGQCSNGDGGCAAVYVDKLYITPAGTLYIGTSGNEASLSCQAVGGEYLTLNLTSPGSNAIYSALLAAQLANKVVQLRANVDSGAPAGCQVLYATIERQ